MDIRNFFSSSKKKTNDKENLFDKLPSKSINNENIDSSYVKSPTSKQFSPIKENNTIDSSYVKSPTSKQFSPVKLNNDLNNVQSNELIDIPKELKDIITWNIGESVPYSALVDCFESVAKHSGRLDKEEIFTKLFRSIIITSPNDLIPIVYLSSNAIAPAYEGLELGIGDSLLVKAICEATGRKREAVEEDYRREGDLGVVALLSRTSQKTLSFAAKPKPLLTSFVLDQLRKITETKGESAQSRKVNIIKSIMIRCQGAEAKYIVRSLQGKLRIGTAEQTVLVALAHAFAQSPPTKVLSLIFTDKEKSIQTDDNDEDEIDSDSNAVEANDINKLLESVVEKEPDESKKLRLNYKKLSKEEKNDIAVIIVKRAFSESPSVDILVNALLNNPLYQLYKECKLVTGIPVAPMLAKPTKQIGEVLKRLSGLSFTMEYKYDGERAQVHLLENGTVKIFSRNSEDNSEKYPDLMDVIRRAHHESVTSCVIDAEVVAFDREKGCLLPFQILSTRKRKVDDGEEDNQKVKVVLQAFDLLYINGKSLLSQSLRQRRSLLHSCFQQEDGYFYFASSNDHVENGDTEPIEIFMQEACNAMSEGLMVKTLDSNSSYEPSKRSLNWLKLKKDYIDGMGICDSVDLVVIGGYHGRGKRVNAYGAYLMACYDPDRDEYQSVCKVGTGFKDEDLLKLNEKTTQLIIPSKRKPVNYNVGEALEPDDWFETKLVWELQAADLSKSSVHKGAIGRVDSSGSRGIGLRFPRYIRERDDKKPENATSAAQIADLYFSQGEIEGVGKEDDDEDGDII